MFARGPEREIQQFHWLKLLREFYKQNKNMSVLKQDG